jgi:hypothetical protein
MIAASLAQRHAVVICDEHQDSSGDVEPPPEYDSGENAAHEARVEKQLRDFLCAAFAHLDVRRALRVGPDIAQEIVQYSRRYREGINPQSRLPFLATYLGHKNIHSTLVYLTVTQDLLQQASERFRVRGAQLLRALPEGGNA